MAIYYISPSGDDGNPGTIGSPWATPAHTYAAGDIVYFRGGSYNVQLDPGQSGTSGNPITFLAYPNETPLLRGVSATENIIKITTNWIVVDGLHVDYNPAHTQPAQSGSKWRWAYVKMSGSNIVLNNINVFKDTLQDPDADYDDGYLQIGVHFSAGSNNTLQNSHIEGTNKGVTINGSTLNPHVRNNCITHTVQSGIVIQPDSVVSTLRGTVIEGNIIEESWLEDGIQFQAEVSGVADNWGTIIRYNLFRNNGENAIDLKGARYVTIEWNVFTGTLGSNNGRYGGNVLSPGNNRNAFSTLSMGSGQAALNIIARNNALYDNTRGTVQEFNDYKIYNNLFLYNNHDYAGADSTYDPTGGSTMGLTSVNMTYSANRVRDAFFNNISGGHRSVQLAFSFHPSATNVRLDYNLYFGGVGGDARLAEMFASPTPYVERTFSSWQAYVATKSTIIGKEANSQLLANLAALGLTNISDKPTGVHTAFNFKPTPSSPAYKTGGYHTKTSSSGSGTALPVDDAAMFRTAYASSNASGDPIFVNGQKAYIVSINYNTNVLTLDRSITWSNAQNVFYGHSGTPNIGIQFQDYDFIILPKTGVQFNDTSTGCTLTSWNWEYQLDGGTWTSFATTSNPFYIFTTTGEYSVRLTASCGATNDTITKLLHILVL